MSEKQTPTYHHYFSLGSNIGSRVSTIQRAIKALTPGALGRPELSHWYETIPVDYEDQPDFINIALGFLSKANPHRIRDFAKNIEWVFNDCENKVISKGPRKIDIDLLLSYVVEDSPKQPDYFLTLGDKQHGPFTANPLPREYKPILIKEEHLEIPHKSMQNRAFVLEPLKDIAATRVHPTYNKTIEQLYNELERFENDVRKI
jgi:2-amino-4-hydroxy-6-hydroxymethyldihydropteridine diphosphokinase